MNRTKKVRTPRPARAIEASASGIGPMPPTLGLAKLIAREGAQWRVEVAGVKRMAGVDGGVDPALLDEAQRLGVRVVLELGSDPLIVGCLHTRRAVTIDADDVVRLRAAAVTVEGRDEVTLKSAGAFVRLKGAEVETYGSRVVHTARELFKVLGRMVKIN